MAICGYKMEKGLPDPELIKSTSQQNQNIMSLTSLQPQRVNTTNNVTPLCFVFPYPFFFPLFQILFKHPYISHIGMCARAYVVPLQ